MTNEWKPRMTCAKHAAKPVTIYEQCVGCELERLHAEVAELRAALRAPVERQQLNVERGPKAIPVERQAPEWISTKDQSPQAGALIAKRWKSGAVWAGVYCGTAKGSSFDEWLLLAAAPSAPGREE